MPASDAIVIGGGHNGLCAAAYLARAGLRVRLFERRSLLGGACVTEELWPGYRVSRGAYVAGLVRPALLRELRLSAQGLRFLRRDPSSFTPLPDGRGLFLGPDAARTRASIAAFSARDAERYPAYEGFLERIARGLEPLLDAPPPELSRLRGLRPSALWNLGAALFRLRGSLPRALALLGGAARPLLERWFESEPLRATLATDAVIGAWAPPSAPGTGYVLMHHVMGETGGARGVWAYVKGGMGAFSDALASAARAAGASLELDSEVRAIELEAGRAVGVALADGSRAEARAIVSNLDPQRTFLTLLPGAALPGAFERAVRSIDFRSGSAKLNLALDRLPRFRGRGSARTGAGPEHRGTIHAGAASLDELERAFEQAAAGEIPERPMVELTLPSALDPELAPAGRHVASLFVQYTPELSRAAWAAGARDALARRSFAVLDEVAPGFSASVLECEVLAPPDLEDLFGLTGGNLFHGAMVPGQLGPRRPVAGWAGYRTPIPGLYLCGAGSHPGGGVMGACGRNASRVVERDLRAGSG